MIIANNISALFDERQLNIQNKEKEKAMRKLSSGYRINQAADDAAGLGISEKMRAMIRGLDQAERNSQEGISLIQVGEGALGEVHAMLDRLTELADQSANGTYLDMDREMMQDELEQICDEISRIAETTNFNTINLFQNKGYAYERTRDTTSSTVAASTGSLLAAGSRTLQDLLANTAADEINIVYVESSAERVDALVTTQQTDAGSQNTLTNEIQIGGKALSQILKTEIIPNTIENILANYPAFSYLRGSSIGIGLEYFQTPATTLAYVKGQVQSGGTVDGSGNVISRRDMITYTLGVNTAVLNGITGRNDPKVQELEATIAHEMIHAFMDEATTTGMFGLVASSTGGRLTTSAAKFPDWFVEGMAQTASGPGNWLTAMKIDSSSTDAAIQSAIQAAKLGSGNTASQYGTGYLACMYLGAVIAGNGTLGSTVDAPTIATGLTKLMNEVIGGKSLSDTIKTLTSNKFADTADFVTKFNTGSNEIGQFVRALLTATGSGKGGIVSGDLQAGDLTQDTVLNGINLFQLEPGNTAVKNLYPSGYNVYSGGTTNTVTGTVAPTDFVPTEASLTYGDFVVSGVPKTDIVFSNNTLTITGSSNARISFKNGVTSSGGKIVLNGSGNVTLAGVDLSAADALTINAGNITYSGENKLAGVKLAQNVKVTFTGTGRLEVGTFNSDNSNEVTFQGGAVVVGTNGANSIGTGTKVKVDRASVTAKGLMPVDVTATGNNLHKISLDSSLWGNQLKNMGNIVSISFDGAQGTKMLIKQNENAVLWLDQDSAATPYTKHMLTLTDVNGVSRKLVAKWDDTNAKFVWATPPKPFTITKAGGAATEGIDYSYADDGKLVIMTAGNYEISGGSINNDQDWGTVKGSIQIKDGIGGAVGIKLDGVTCTPSAGCAFDLGTGNQVTLTLADQKTNQFVSQQDHAGIRLGSGTTLTIQEEGAGKLEARGGYGGAGIGCSNTAANAAANSSIKIVSGDITAIGGDYGAGIGAADKAAFGNIEINGGKVTAHGGQGSAGIGGGNDAAVGNITITDGTIVADSRSHGAGIGGGWGGTAINGEIHISGGTISASSTMHGTGIGAGCSGTSQKITIDGTANIELAQGGDEGAGIGASWTGACGEIEISGKASIDKAKGGNGGAGIGSGGSGSRGGKITIDTTGKITAEGGINGVGIGSGYQSSSIGAIEITQGTITAKGGDDSTGIGAGRGSTSADITIGDATGAKKVVLTAQGGMTHNGGNILSYTDGAHNNAGTVKIQGSNTSVRPGGAGEGKYSTSGVTDGSGGTLYAYPVYLFKETGGPTLEAGVDLETNGLMPLDTLTAKFPTMDPTKPFSKITISSDASSSWAEGLTHDPLDEHYAFLWLKPQDQKLTVTFDYTDTSGATQQGTATLDLIYYDNAGVFRVKQQKKPADAKPPGYTDDPVVPGQNPDPVPDPEDEGGGIILQIGAREGQILEIPRFYFCLEALKMEKLDISTQENAWATIPVVRNAKGRVSEIRGAYGAYQNRLEHTIKNLGQSSENLSAAESRIRDANMAKEMVKFSVHSIISQVGQSLLAQDMKRPEQVLQLLQE